MPDMPDSSKVVFPSEVSCASTTVESTGVSNNREKACTETIDCARVSFHLMIFAMKMELDGSPVMG